MRFLSKYISSKIRNKDKKRAKKDGGGQTDTSEMIKGNTATSNRRNPGFTKGFRSVMQRPPNHSEQTMGTNFNRDFSNDPNPINQRRLLPVISSADQESQFVEWESNQRQERNNPSLNNNLLVHRLAGNNDWSAFSNQTQTLAQNTAQRNWAGDQCTGVPASAATPAVWTDSEKCVNIGNSGPSSYTSEELVMKDHVLMAGKNRISSENDAPEEVIPAKSTKTEETVNPSNITLQDLKEDAQLLIQIISKSTGQDIDEIKKLMRNQDNKCENDNGTIEIKKSEVKSGRTSGESNKEKQKDATKDEDLITENIDNVSLSDMSDEQEEAVDFDETLLNNLLLHNTDSGASTEPKGLKDMFAFLVEGIENGKKHLLERNEILKKEQRRLLKLKKELKQTRERIDGNEKVISLIKEKQNTVSDDIIQETTREISDLKECLKSKLPDVLNCYKHFIVGNEQPQLEQSYINIKECEEMLVRLQYIVRRRDARKRLSSVSNLQQSVAGALSSSLPGHTPLYTSNYREAGAPDTIATAKSTPSAHEASIPPSHAPSNATTTHAAIATAASSHHAPRELGTPRMSRIQRISRNRMNSSAKKPELEVSPSRSKPRSRDLADAERTQISGKVDEAHAEVEGNATERSTNLDNHDTDTPNSASCRTDHSKQFFIQQSQQQRDTKRLFTRAARDANYTRMRSLTDNISMLTPKQSDDLLNALRNSAAPSFKVYTKNISNNANTSLDQCRNEINEDLQTKQ